jgi:flagellar biosynthesis protein FlhG
VKRISEQTHYEILEVAPDAAPEQIERAYRVVRATYATDSLASYSLYDEAELRALQERIELAYAVLADAERRSAYDTTLGAGPRIELALSFADGDAEEPDLESAPEIHGFEESVDDGPFDGARLRRWRVARGIELDRIAATTKISLSYLRSLEEERFDALPATVYVRGFLTAYARAVGLDAGSIVPRYMERIALARPDKAHRPVLRRAR